MQVVESQDNNRPQIGNPRHPANVASRQALARVRSQYQGPRQPQRGNTGGSILGALEHGVSAVGHGVERGYNATVHAAEGAHRAEVRGWRHPGVDKGHGFNPFDVLGQVSRQLAHSVNPRTRGGIANIASMFAPGARGEGYGANPLPEDVLSEWQPAGHFTNYTHKSGGDPLARGVEREGPINPNGSRKGAGVRGLIRRAQGVGGYQRPNEGLSEMARIEALRKAQSKVAQVKDDIKQYSNRAGQQNREISNNMLMQHAYEQKTGGALIPYRGRSGDRPFMDSQPHDYTDRLKLIQMFKNSPDNPFLQELNHNPTMQAIWDMLFAGKGLPNTPRRP